MVRDCSRPRGHRRRGPGCCTPDGELICPAQLTPRAACSRVVVRDGAVESRPAHAYVRRGENRARDVTRQFLNGAGTRRIGQRAAPQMRARAACRQEADVRPRTVHRMRDAADLSHAAKPTPGGLGWLGDCRQSSAGRMPSRVGGVRRSPSSAPTTITPTAGQALGRARWAGATDESER